MVKLATCFNSSKGTFLDVLLSNKPKSFQKLVATILRLKFFKLPPKVAKYRSYENFDENKFCHELDQILIKGDLCKVKDPYNKLTNI